VRAPQHSLPVKSLSAPAGQAWQNDQLLGRPPKRTHLGTMVVLQFRTTANKAFSLEVTDETTTAREGRTGA